MKTRILSCFRDFHCIAGACRDSCCIGWEIDVDEQSFRRYQTLTGPFGEELRANIATEPDGTHHYILEGERCPFLNEQGLCRQILALGEDVLCEICARHPRFYETFGEVQEMGMGLACEEAARLLFTDDHPLTLLEQGAGTGPEGEDGAVYDFLLEWREQCFAAACDPEQTIHQRLGALLLLGRQADAALQGENFILEPAPELCPGQGLLWLERLTELEPIDGEWTEALEDGLAAAEYPELLEDFAEAVEVRDYERLLVYLLFRYALKSVWDWEPAYWINFAVFCVLTVELLDFGRWLRNGQRFTMQDRQDTARIFSKEIEYDPDIVEGLGDLFEQTEPFCC